MLWGSVELSSIIITSTIVVGDGRVGGLRGGGVKHREFSWSQFKLRIPDDELKRLA